MNTYLAKSALTNKYPSPGGKRRRSIAIAFVVVAVPEILALLFFAGINGNPNGALRGASQYLSLAFSIPGLILLSGYIIQMTNPYRAPRAIWGASSAYNLVLTVLSVTPLTSVGILTFIPAVLASILSLVAFSSVESL